MHSERGTEEYHEELEVSVELSWPKFESSTLRIQEEKKKHCRSVEVRRSRERDMMTQQGNNVNLYVYPVFEFLAVGTEIADAVVLQLLTEMSNMQFNSCVCS
jgi:hypothetical protein